MKDFFNLINAIFVDDLGFRADMFPTDQFLPELKDRVLADILEPAYGTAEPWQGGTGQWHEKSSVTLFQLIA